MIYGAKRLFYCSNKLEKLHNHPHKSLIMNGINEKIKIPSTYIHLTNEYLKQSMSKCFP